ncbi:hypothetical protein TNCV_1102781 [Trichonephila clavipes]|nr:hypothetical protein TNCV_1102781 [Trichonephila clavipes]
MISIPRVDSRRSLSSHARECDDTGSRHREQFTRQQAIHRLLAGENLHSEITILSKSTMSTTAIIEMIEKKEPQRMCLRVVIITMCSHVS